MIFSRTAFAVSPSNREYTDQSVPAKLYSLLANPELHRNYVIQVEPYDKVALTTVVRNYGAGISRIPGSSYTWEPYVIDAFNVEERLLSGPLGIGGSGGPSFGDVRIAIGEEAEKSVTVRDEFSELGWNRRVIKLLLGGDTKDGWVFGDYSVMFYGLIEEATWNSDTLVFIIRDSTVKLDTPIQTNLYTGAGQYEGGEDIKDTPKPLCYGRPRNISPVMVDRTFLIYQLHDGPVLGIGKVYDKGDGYQFDTDTTNLYAWIPIPGEHKFRTDLSRGMLRLGATPLGQVTADDVMGDSDSGVLRERPGELITRILKSRLGFVDADIDLGAMGALDATGRVQAIYIRQTISVTNVVREITLPRGYTTFDTTGRFTAGQVRFSAPVIVLDIPYISTISRERTRLPTWRLSMGHTRNWTLMQENELALLSVDPLNKDFATNEYRRVIVPDASVKVRQPGAFDDTVDTLWANAEDAQAEADEVFDLISADRDTYNIVASEIQFLVHVGNTVRVVYPRYQLDAGRDFVVLGIVENTTMGTTQLTVWG